jgi:hypothetical protein
MPPTKKRKLNAEAEDKSVISESEDERQMSGIEGSGEEDWSSESEGSQSSNSAASSPDTEEVQKD